MPMLFKYFNVKDDRKVTKFVSFFFDKSQKRSIEIPNLDKAKAVSRAEDPFPNIVSLSAIVVNLSIFELLYKIYNKLII